MTSFRSLSWVLVVALGGLCGVGPVPAAAYSSVYVFGDSSSDIGRIAALTGGIPGPPDYAPGRFSNGPVAVEVMTQVLVGSPLTLDHDYAFGGARTGVSPFSFSDNANPFFNGTGLLNQTGLFRFTVGPGHTDPNALYVVFAGANDIDELPVFANTDGTQWDRVIGNLETAIDNLAADGARHFLVPNLPNAGLPPASLALGPVTAATFSQYAASFNVLFAQRIAAFDAARAAIDIHTFDVYGFMTSVSAQVTAHGSYLGVSNVTTACQGDSNCNPNAAFYWDSVHLTTKAHTLLGLAMAEAVPEPGTGMSMLVGVAGLVVIARRRAG
ncbi:MAG: SGNH/GDSL hydrolase family protein [Myxococcota bacterium]